MKRILFLSAVILFFWAGNKSTEPIFNLKEFEKSLTYIPMGSYMFMDSASDFNEDIKAKNHNSGRMVSLKAFYMSNHEVSNAEYRYFLSELKSTDTLLYHKMLPDTLIWRNKLAYNEPYVKYYFRHPAYGNYPVVGVTHEQAEYYCKWLTARYMKEPKRKYKQAEFMLPNVYQWEYAADGGLALSDFPWGGPYMRGTKGEQVADFLEVSEASIKRDKVYEKDSNGLYREVKTVVATGNSGYAGDFGPTSYNYTGDITSPVMSFQPNGYGLHNMAGNVNEYVAEKGITKGGGWRDYGYYLQNWVEQPYDSANYRSDETGFRVAMEIKN